MLKRYTLFVLIFVGTFLVTAKNAHAQTVQTFPLNYDGNDLTGYSFITNNPYSDWVDCQEEGEDEYGEYFCVWGYYHQQWVQMDGYLNFNGSNNYIGTTYDYEYAQVGYDVYHPPSGTYDATGIGSTGENLYYFECTDSNDCVDDYAGYDYTGGGGSDDSGPYVVQPHLTYATYNGSFTAPGTLSVSADPGVVAIDYTFTFNGIPEPTQYNWPNGTGNYVSATDTQYFGTYILGQAKSSADNWGWVALAGLAAQAIISPPPPPTVTITNADITSDQIAVSLGPAGQTGTLIVTVGSTQVYSGTNASGPYTFSFNRQNLPNGHYTNVSAQWTTPGGTGVGIKSVTFTVLGVYLHTQYNTPNENSCTQPPASAFITTSACAWNPAMLKSDFISQSWLNGSGNATNFGLEQNESFCFTHSTPPAGASGDSFRPVSAIQPSCQGYGVSNSTLASGVGSQFSCGDQVLIVGVGVKTVTDTCAACGTAAHLDNYTTQAACAKGSVPSLGNFQTILLR